MLSLKQIKPLGALLGLCIAFCMAGEALAAEPIVSYSGSAENSVDAQNVDAYKTVLITKRSDGSIVYVAQEDEGFASATVNFLLKNGVQDKYGLYDVKIGNNDGDPAKKYFYIGTDRDNQSDEPMERLTTTIQDGDTYTAGFYLVVDADSYKSYNSLKVGYYDSNSSDINYGVLPLKTEGFPKMFTGGDMVLVFELTDIEADELDSVSVFLSQDAVGDGSAYK